MGHISDRTLDTLLDGTIDDEGEVAIEEHVRHCDRCAHRLREWELLFPQIKSLIPTGEHPVFTPQPVAAARTPSVFVPDWSPPRSRQALPTRLAWGLVIVLAIGAAFLLFQRTTESNAAVSFLPESIGMAAESGSADSTGMGSGIVDDSTLPVTSAISPPPDTAKVTPALQPQSPPAPAERPAGREPEVARGAETHTQVASRGAVEQDVRRPAPERDTPVSFPIKADPATKRSTTPAPPAATGPVEREPTTPLPEQFQRVTLGEAISRLSGTVRLIQGLTPEAVEIARGSAIPGADQSRAVVRVVYNAPEGRLIMDQQRLGRPGSNEPNIAISTSPSGVSVARWIDRGGFWISLAGRADQQTLLAIANRIR